MDERFPSIAQKSIIIFEHLHTASNSSSSIDHSRIQIQFQAILLNLDDDENSLKSGKDYYITAGVEYGELLMVRQARISTVLIPTVRFNSSLFSVHRKITIFYLGLRTQHRALHHIRALENSERRLCPLQAGSVHHGTACGFRARNHATNGIQREGDQGEHIFRIPIHSQVLRRMCFMLERSSTTWEAPSPATATISRPDTPGRQAGRPLTTPHSFFRPSLTETVSLPLHLNPQ